LSDPTYIFDALVLGGGAAGLMCAIEAGRRGKKVAVLERADRIGKKILISGGGRCNFTNLHCGPENFLSANPHFAKSALARYQPKDVIALVRKHRIPFHEKKLGQLFCDHSAQDVVAMLEEECRAAGVKIYTQVRIREVAQRASFEVVTEQDKFVAQSVVVATGGLSIPKIGATSFGYELAKQFGLDIVPCRPALVPLIWKKEDAARYKDLSGVSTDAVVTADGVSFNEKLLLTHHGLSGPAVLQASSYWRAGTGIRIDLAPDKNVTGSLLESSSGRTLASLQAALRNYLPHRLADRWIKFNPPKSFTNVALEEWEGQLHNWTVTPAGDEGYVKAEVTAGGVDTAELSSTTMECEKVPGLFFIGEVVDVTGQLGGFNFQWAWASGACAGRAL
jgi:predicted Rossmann fold flavoprotein